MSHNLNLPKMMTIKEVSRTGILPEHALRVMLKKKEIPHVMVGNRALINFDLLVKMLQGLNNGSALDD